MDAPCTNVPAAITIGSSYPGISHGTGNCVAVYGSRFLYTLCVCQKQRFVAHLYGLGNVASCVGMRGEYRISQVFEHLRGEDAALERLSHHMRRHEQALEERTVGRLVGAYLAAQAGAGDAVFRQRHQIGPSGDISARGARGRRPGF